ncbi:MAG: hypothetical protein HKO59_07965, partial [Phycisphaerales bacterium]|nr:hypothetical protein [Phycisphaerales bacterium]
MNVHLDQPGFLALALLAVPLAILGWRRMAGASVGRRVLAITLRSTLVLACVVMLARPNVRREHDHLTVIGLLDVSGSVQRFARIPSDDDTRRVYL